MSQYYDLTQYELACFGSLWHLRLRDRYIVAQREGNFGFTLHVMTEKNKNNAEVLSFERKIIGLQYICETNWYEKKRLFHNAKY